MIFGTQPLTIVYKIERKPTKQKYFSQDTFFFLPTSCQQFLPHNAPTKSLRLNPQSSCEVTPSRVMSRVSPAEPQNSVLCAEFNWEPCHAKSKPQNWVTVLTVIFKAHSVVGSSSPNRRVKNTPWWLRLAKNWCTFWIGKLVSRRDYVNRAKVSDFGVTRNIKKKKKQKPS